MTQLVYVHGVANRREDQDFESDREKRRKMFEDHAFRGNPLTFRDPYWGEFGAVPKFGWASIPKGKGTALAIGAGIGYATASPASNTMWIEAAKQDFLAVAHTLSLELDSDNESEAKLAEALVGYALSLDPTVPHWVGRVADDDAFLQRLESESSAWFNSPGTTTLGLGDTLRGIGRSIAGGTSNLVNSPLAKGVRALTPKIGTFVGDVFRYLKEGDSRGAIRNAIDTALVEAAEVAHSSDEKLMAVGHSMGGIILYDMLNDPAYLADVKSRLGRDLKIDLFLTIGSQPGLFEEMDLFQSSIPGQKGSRPACVARWWNVYDRMDVLSFVAEDVFDDVIDLEADTLASVPKAHGAYLFSQLVHKRLHKRMKDEGLIA